MQPPEPDLVTPLISPQQRGILIAACGGSLISLLFMREPFNWKTAVAAMASGLFSSYYCVELIGRTFKLDPGWYGAMGAAFGLLAMTLLGGIFKLAQSWREDPQAFLERWVPWLKKKGG